MSLRIACDLDGTVADMDAALQREATRLFGLDVDLHTSPAIARTESAEDVEGTIVAHGETPDAREEVRPRADVSADAQQPPRRALSTRELRALWSHVTRLEGFWTSLGEIEPGAVARVHALATKHRWEVLFLTQRPSSVGEIVQVQSQRWLEAHGFEMPSVYVMRSGSRGRVAEALGLDAVIDDRPENCLDVVTDSQAKAILVWRSQRGAVPAGMPHTGIEVVHSMQEALDCLEQFMDERTGRSTFMGRLRNAILPKQ